MGKTISAKLIARAVLVSSSFAAKGKFFSYYRRPAEGTLLSEEFKPFTDMDDPGFLRREFQASFRQEILDHRFYFLFKLVL